jgi:hypothetical protein
MTPITRNNRFTLRLSDDEKAELEQLSNHLNLDKSATVRHALKSFSKKKIRPQAGVFMTTNQLQFPIQFDSKETDER